MKVKDLRNILKKLKDNDEVIIVAHIGNGLARYELPFVVHEIVGPFDDESHRVDLHTAPQPAALVDIPQGRMGLFCPILHRAQLHNGNGLFRSPIVSRSEGMTDTNLGMCAFESCTEPAEVLWGEEVPLCRFHYMNTDEEPLLEYVSNSPVQVVNPSAPKLKQLFLGTIKDDESLATKKLDTAFRVPMHGIPEKATVEFFGGVKPMTEASKKLHKEIFDAATGKKTCAQCGSTGFDMPRYGTTALGERYEGCSFCAGEE